MEERRKAGVENFTEEKDSKKLTGNIRKRCEKRETSRRWRTRGDQARCKTKAKEGAVEGGGEEEEREGDEEGKGAEERKGEEERKE